MIEVTCNFSFFYFLLSSHYVDSDYLVTPVEACVAMNKKLRRAHCQFLTSAFDWEKILVVNKKDFMKEGKLNKIHIVEVTSAGSRSID